MIKLLKNMQKREWLMALACAVFVVGQVYFDLTLPDYMTTGTLSGVTYDAANNTGSIIHGDVPTGDLDRNGVIDIRDALIMLRCVLDGEFPYGSVYNGKTQVTLTDVLWLFAQIAK